MTIQAKTPCLLTCIKELNAPLYVAERDHGLLRQAGGRYDYNTPEG